ncbi:unnamed protein product, partial [Rotaria sp. Silwood1]
TNEPEYGIQEINTIKQQYPNDFNDDLLTEWKVFRKYLFAQQQTYTNLTQRKQCINLVKKGMIRGIYPQLSLAAEIFLCAPISTATVERDFSTMNRILTGLRNRLTTEHLEQLMRISIEGPADLDNDIKNLIIDCWKTEDVVDATPHVLPENQAVLKRYYDSFPNIDELTNTTNPDVKKAEELTKSILNKKSSGNVTDKNTACHILNKLLGDEDQQCLFFDSANGINLHDASGNLADIDSEDRPFVLELKSSEGLGGDNSKKTFNDDMKLAETLTHCIEQKRNHPIIEDIRDRLAKAHEVDKNSIVIKAVFVGSFNIAYTVKDLAKSVIKKLFKISQQLKKQFPQFLRAKIHPLLFRPSFDIAYFDARGDKTFSSGPDTHEVGPPGRTKKYTSPSGWTRYGLKVLGKSEYKNDEWLHPFQHPGNWYRAFHGTGRATKVDFGNSNADFDQTAAPINALASIFKQGFRPARVAAHGPGVYCSPNPVWLGDSVFVGAVELDTEKGKKKFKCMFQVAVNPESVQCPINDIWVAPQPQDIRPYGILIKEA